LTLYAPSVKPIYISAAYAIVRGWLARGYLSVMYRMERVERILKLLLPSGSPTILILKIFIHHMIVIAVVIK